MVVLFGAIATLSGCGPAREASPDSPPASGLTIRRIEPASSQKVIKCQPSQRFEVTYELRNNGAHPLSDLKLGTRCGCEVTVDIPAELGVGDAAVVSFRIPCPAAGVLQRQIPIFAGSAVEPLAFIQVSVLADIDPPILLGGSRMVSMTVIEGDSSAPALHLETVERKGRPNWLTELRHDQSLEVAFSAPTVTEIPEADPALVRRHYEFPVAIGSLDVGSHSLTVELGVRESLGARLAPLHLAVSVVGRMAVVPRQVTFSDGVDETVRVSVVFRGSDGAVSRLEYDPSLFEVTQVGSGTGRILPYDVRRKSDSPAVDESQIVFHGDDSSAQTLAVKFSPNP